MEESDRVDDEGRPIVERVELMEVFRKCSGLWRRRGLCM